MKEFTLDNPIEYKKIKFFTLLENGLLLENRQGEKNMLLFSSIHNAYIKKNKFCFAFKIGILFLFIATLAFLSLYLPSELVLVSPLLVIPFLIKINSYKWYEFNLVLNNECVIQKTFYNPNKQQYFVIVQTIKKEIFYHRVASNTAITKAKQKALKNKIAADAILRTA